jgi:hypothetical protein
MTQRILLLLPVDELTVCRRIVDGGSVRDIFARLDRDKRARWICGNGPETFRSTGSLSVADHAKVPPQPLM